MPTRRSTSQNKIPPPPPTVAEAIERFVAGLALDAVADVRAAQARVLATKLDTARDAGEGAAAVAACSKELRALVGEMIGAAEANGDLLRELLVTPDTGITITDTWPDGSGNTANPPGTGGTSMCNLTHQANAQFSVLFADVGTFVLDVLYTASSGSAFASGSPIAPTDPYAGAITITVVS